MTLTETTTNFASRLRPVAFDLYRDIHKGIRSELFAVTAEAGRVDPSDPYGVAALAEQVRRTIDLLLQHASHEDRAIGPVLERELPALADRIAADHFLLDARMELLLHFADAAGSAPVARAAVHELYVELSSFTGAYLLHQDVEEREVMPALEAAIGVDAVLGIHGAILSGMPPHELIGGLAVMFPAMNVDDRTELLGGMRASAPAEAFEGVWSLARSVLATADHQAVAARLGLS